MAPVVWLFGKTNSNNPNLCSKGYLPARSTHKLQEASPKTSVSCKCHTLGHLAREGESPFGFGTNRDTKLLACRVVVLVAHLPSVDQACVTRLKWGREKCKFTPLLASFVETGNHVLFSTPGHSGLTARWLLAQGAEKLANVAQVTSSNWEAAGGRVGGAYVPVPTVQQNGDESNTPSKKTRRFWGRWAVERQPTTALKGNRKKKKKKKKKKTPLRGFGSRVPRRGILFPGLRRFLSRTTQWDTTTQNPGLDSWTYAQAPNHQTSQAEPPVMLLLVKFVITLRFTLSPNGHIKSRPARGHFPSTAPRSCWCGTTSGTCWRRVLVGKPAIRDPDNRQRAASLTERRGIIQWISHTHKHAKTGVAKQNQD